MRIKPGSEVYHAGDGTGIVLQIAPKDKDFQALVKFGTCHEGWYPFRQLCKPEMDS